MGHSLADFPICSIKNEQNPEGDKMPLFLMCPGGNRERLESRPNPPTGMSALHVAQAFQPAGFGDFPVPSSWERWRLAGTPQRFMVNLVAVPQSGMSPLHLTPSNIKAPTRRRGCYGSMVQAAKKLGDLHPISSFGKKKENNEGSARHAR